MAPTASSKPSKLIIPSPFASKDASGPLKSPISPTKGPYLHPGPAASFCSSESDSDMLSLASAPSHPPSPSPLRPGASSDSVFFHQNHLVRDVNANDRTSTRPVPQPLADTCDAIDLPNPYPLPDPYSQTRSASGSTSTSGSSYMTSESSSTPNTLLMPPQGSTSPSPYGRSRSPLRSSSPLSSSPPPAPHGRARGHQRSLSPQSSLYFNQTRQSQHDESIVRPFSPVSPVSPSLSTFPYEDARLLRDEFDPYQDYVESPISECPLPLHEADGDTPKAKGHITARLVSQNPRRAETSPFPIPSSPPPFASNASISSSSHIHSITATPPPRSRSPLPNPPRNLNVPAALKPSNESSNPYRPGHQRFSSSSTSLISVGAQRPLSMTITDLTFGHESGNETSGQAQPSPHHGLGGSPGRHLRSQSYDVGMALNDAAHSPAHLPRPRASFDFDHSPPRQSPPRRFGHTRSHSYDPGMLPIPLPPNSRDTRRWPREEMAQKETDEDDTIFTGFGGVGRPTPSPSPSPSPSTPARRPLPIPKPSWSTTDIPSRPSSAMGYASSFMGMSGDLHLRSQSTGGTGTGNGLVGLGLDESSFGSAPNLYGNDDTPKRTSSTSPRTRKKLVKSPPSSPLASPGREGGVSPELRAKAVNYVKLYRKADASVSTPDEEKAGRKGFRFPSPKKKKGIVNGDGVFVSGVQHKLPTLESERPKSPVKKLAGIFGTSSPEKEKTKFTNVVLDDESPTKALPPKGSLPWVTKEASSSASSLKLSLPSPTKQQPAPKPMTVKETFVIDPSLPSTGLRERNRENLRFEVEGGNMDVDVWLLGTGMLEERLVLDRTWVHLGLVSPSGNDSERKLITRIRAPGKHRPSFRLTLNTIMSSSGYGSNSVLSPSHTGTSFGSSSAASSSKSSDASTHASPLVSNAPSYIHLSLPKSFQGHIVVRSLKANVTMSKDVHAQEITSDRTGERSFFIGEGGSLRDPDEVNVTLDEGNVWLQYIDESQVDGPNKDGKKKAWWKR
ncbi:hypothetical protein Moror_6127 [Moniliophthora roreri MCA 2997]|uniref:DUF7330 domain-containing protein n=1 Tax=Moniliophthora roreri (strain MCA 2997) TaxID=1381753 RepID=V2WSI8_MONRO|nr:hypothetical protein Moror_6127 [Moniliophthora roreri MCA 2997]